MSAVIRKANVQDMERLKSFADSSKVSMEGTYGEPEGYYMMENEEGRLMAMAGLESVDGLGLLRSLVIDSEMCDLSLFVRFFDAVVVSAEQTGCTGAAFMTPSPELFETLGFEKWEETSEHAPETISKLARSAKGREAALMVKKF